MSLELIVVVIAAIAVVGIVALSITSRRAAGERQAPKPAERPGPLDGARDVVDRSIGMYVLRRLTGRSTAPPTDDSATAPTARAAAADIARGAPPVAAATPRERLVRDAGIALIALAAFGLVAVLVWPGGPGGQPAPTRLGVTGAELSEPSGVRSSASGIGGSGAATTTAPTSAGVAEAFYDQVVGTTTTREHISWSGTEVAGAGIVKYQLQVSVNGGSYSTITLSRATATSIDRTLTTNWTYRFRVRATDRQGNVSAYVYGPTFKPARIQDTSSSVVYTGSWTTTSNSKALGGSHHYATSTAARARYTGSMRDVAWIATRTTTSGSAQVWIDGALAATVNLRVASNGYHALIFHRHFSSLGTHAIEIRPMGGGRVYLDAFTVDR